MRSLFAMLTAVSLLPAGAALAKSEGKCVDANQKKLKAADATDCVKHGATWVGASKPAKKDKPTPVAALAPAPVKAAPAAALPTATAEALVPGGNDGASVP